MRIDWTQDEVELVVAGYFAMWAEVRAGHPVNKAERYRALAALLPGPVFRSTSFQPSDAEQVLETTSKLEEWIAFHVQEQVAPGWLRQEREAALFLR